MMKKPKFILMDIEGTTTDINFVHKTLFPYAKNNMSEFIHFHGKEEKVAQALSEVRLLCVKEGQTSNTIEQTIDILVDWIEKDRKVKPLKDIQGMIWKKGYENQEFHSHIYSDILPAWKSWKADHVSLGIYSSGSIKAQQLLFKHSTFGDLNPYLDFYFDTQIGHKREKESYHQICQTLKIDPKDILFLSDVVEELEAAKQSGFNVVHVLRPGTKYSNVFSSIESFDQIHWT